LTESGGKSLPGLLKTTRTKILPGDQKDSSTRAFVGFNASNIQLDASGPGPQKSVGVDTFLPPTQKTYSLNDQVSIPKKQDEALVELRSYTSLMDEYSLHNFMIWNGRALKDTPEFQSYMRTYKNQWSYIVTIIGLLEKLMSENLIKLAIVSGLKVAEYGSLNLPTLQTFQLLDCLCNADQIRPQLTSFAGDSQDHILRATLKIQTLARRWFALYRYKALKARLLAAITIQSTVRRFVMRCKAVAMMHNLVTQTELKWKNNMNMLMQEWQKPQSRTQKKVVIYIPSISASEFFRTNMSHIGALQNATISCLAQLADPRVEMIYITPVYFGPTEKAYIEKFLALMNISILPNRLTFMVPELSRDLPDTMPVAQALWYSSSTLRKLRCIHEFNHGDSVIIPGDLGWVEKRIANYLGIRMLSSEPIVAHELTSKSQSKKVFLETGMNIPIGAHDIYTEEDLLVSLTRLMSSNLDISRWVIRLNADHNGEGTVYVDASKLPIIQALKGEQFSLMHTSADPEAWFERHVQLNARKRILNAFQESQMSIMQICRRDLFPSWSVFLKFMKQVGVVVEAEPPLMQGRLESYCFVDPCGEAHVSPGGVVISEHYQRQGVVYPQAIVHPNALEGATRAVAGKLYDTFGVIGYITVSYTAFYDSFDGTPRLWANGLQFGLNATCGAIWSLAALLEPIQMSRLESNCLLPMVAEGDSLYSP
jgi:IQ domain-containing protein H